MIRYIGRKLFNLLILLAFCYLGMWYYATTLVKNYLENNIKNTTISGIYIGYDNISISGFPNKLNVSLDGIKLELKNSQAEQSSKIGHAKLELDIFGNQGRLQLDQKITLKTSSDQTDLEYNDHPEFNFSFENYAILKGILNRKLSLTDSLSSISYFDKGYNIIESNGEKKSISDHNEINMKIVKEQDGKVFFLDFDLSNYIGGKFTYKGSASFSGSNNKLIVDVKNLSINNDSPLITLSGKYALAAESDYNFSTKIDSISSFLVYLSNVIKIKTDGLKELILSLSGNENKNLEEVEFQIKKGDFGLPIFGNMSVAELIRRYNEISLKNKNE